MQLKKVSVRGVVQGVGFRPFVYRLAHDLGLAGWVLNDSGGVEIEVEGPETALEAFLNDLSAQAPPLARIVSVESTEATPCGYTAFEIRHSVAQEGRYQLISPDIATCADCQRELMDPTDRRYRYPFTNCTNCGPRFTIIRDIPYDRPLTTMHPFAMCPACRREYDDPLDRRFHAQPNACPVCGPHIWLERAGMPGRTLAEQDAAMRLAGQLLRAGEVLALKGLGGFHLACDATNATAVQALRVRKGRRAKALAVMMATLDDVRRHCHTTHVEEKLLVSQQCPIVLLRWREDSPVVPDVAPGNLYLGVMLPYTPLHHILLRDVDRPLVMTSGNLSEEPIAQSNEEAHRRLGHLADAFLLHDRDIYARYDDSVLFAPELAPRLPHVQRTQPIRRSRGYAPFPVRLPFKARQTLATGAELKNTFCLTRDDFAFLSQHIGDMENLETLEHFQTSIILLQHLFRIEPELIAYDLHPDYASTKYALSRASTAESVLTNQRNKSLLVPIQHHHAHIAACLVDNEWSQDDESVIGVAWDGTGYGPDGRIWGGEFFVGSYHGLDRVAHLEYMPMPGGDAAIRNPWRLALGYVHVLGGKAPDLPGIGEQERRIVLQQLSRGLNTPLTSAAGRLFDAIAAFVGIRHQVTYEAQAAIELEMRATRWANSQRVGDGPSPYPFDVEQSAKGMVVRLGKLFQAVQTDLEDGVDPSQIGWRFHRTAAEVIISLCQKISSATSLRTVALSGGCFQNRLLLRLTVPRLEASGFRVLLHRRVPCNDGGISLGQAALAHFAAKNGSGTHEIH
jgi:hydrogenase maturation protein HypF